MIQKYQKETNKTNTTQVMKISCFYMRKRDHCCSIWGSWMINKRINNIISLIISAVIMFCVVVTSACLHNFPLFSCSPVTKLEIINLCQIYWLKHSQNYYCFIVITKIIIVPDFLHGQKIFFILFTLKKIIKLEKRAKGLQYEH